MTPTQALAQSVGAIRGSVSRHDDGRPLGGVAVALQDTPIATVTHANGSYVLHRVPAGRHTVVLHWPGYRAHRATVIVTEGRIAILDAALIADAVPLGEVVVTASRNAEPLMAAPAAVSVARAQQVRAAYLAGQLPNAVADLPGVDLARNGINDFNLNTRGFNSSLSRRVLVLQDGRDLSATFLGAQEWSANQAFDDAGRIELVRGPGSALYGANAFSGVLAITTPSAREAVGTKMSLAGGGLSTLRGSVRRAGLVSAGRLGYKLTAGYSRSDTWSLSRTSLDGLDLRREYESATAARIPANGVERRVLAGQTINPASGAAEGGRDPLVALQGAGRLDYYADNGAVGTVEGGATQVENEVFITGIGRVQVEKALRPWARMSWDHAGLSLAAWYAGRSTVHPQYSLVSGEPSEDHSRTVHAEARYGYRIADRARLALGGSVRQSHVDTRGTLMTAAEDGRSDVFLAGFGQLEYLVSRRVRLIAAARLDDGSLFAAQVSPKAAVVVQPSDGHALRATVNRAFQTPNYAEFFLHVPAAAPSAAPWTLERTLEQFFADVNAVYGGVPAVAALGLPDNLPWTFDSLTPSLALGNAGLAVERVTEWGVGYRGTLGQAAFITVDAYVNHMANFVTDLLPAVNPAYPRYLLTDGGTTVPGWLGALDSVVATLGATNQITSAQEATLRGTIAALLGGYGTLATGTGAALATLPDGRRALVVSYTNAGNVTERGVEVGAGRYLTDELRLEGSYSLFDFDVQQLQSGDSLSPNTPRHKGNLSLYYQGRQGVDVALSARLVGGYDWAAGAYAGAIPASQTVDASAGARLSHSLRLHLVATNVLDQRRYHIYGGSVIGRRILAGVTGTF